MVSRLTQNDFVNPQIIQVLFAYVVFAILQTSFSLPVMENASPFDDLKDFLPVKEIQELKTRHLQNDPSFQATVTYFKSPEWIAMVEDVRNNPDWIEYKNFLKEAGLDFDVMIKQLNVCVNDTDVTGFKIEGVQPSLASFIQDVKATYGIQILKGLQEYLEKSGQNEANKKLREKLSSPTSRDLLEKALAQPALQKIMMKLKEIGVDIDYFLQMIYGFSGWEMTTIKP